MTTNNELIQEMTVSPDTTVMLDNLIADFNRIKNLYVVEGSLEVFKMMLEQEAIAPLVIEAYDPIRVLFPTEKLGLAVIPDAEIPSWRSMWITIYTKLSAEEGFLKLKELDRDWWLDAVIAAPKNDLHINLGWE
jgi:hypothetical protein